MQWVRLYEETGNAGLVCRRCGISWLTLRMWWKRYQQDGEGGLVPRRRRPHHSPNIEVGKQEEQLILKLRKTRNLGARPGLRNRHKPRQYLHPCIHGHICMISDHGVVQSLAEALNQIRPRILSKLELKTYPCACRCCIARR